MERQVRWQERVLGLEKEDMTLRAWVLAVSSCGILRKLLPFHALISPLKSDRGFKVLSSYRINQIQKL